VIGGLASSLLLTLVLVPVVYVALASKPRYMPDDDVPPSGTVHGPPSLSDVGART
jgi:hypothetical protein